VRRQASSECSPPRSQMGPGLCICCLGWRFGQHAWCFFIMRFLSLSVGLMDFILIASPEKPPPRQSERIHSQSDNRNHGMLQKAPATLGDRQPTSLRCILGITRYRPSQIFTRSKLQSIFRQTRSKFTMTYLREGAL